MKYSLFLIPIIALFFNFSPISGMEENHPVKEEKINNEKVMKDQVLRHVVLFKFKENTTEEEITEVQEAFSALPDKISTIKDYEWGTNNSPEGLNKGFTHCFFVTFESEEGRAEYLPHPEHKAFGEVLEPHLDDVLVVDYWANED